MEIDTFCNKGLPIIGEIPQDPEPDNSVHKADQCLHLGLLVLCKGITQWASPRIRYIQASLLKVWNHSPECIQDQVLVPYLLLKPLWLWPVPENIHRGLPICLPDTQILKINASLMEWGLTLGTRESKIPGTPER